MFVFLIRTFFYHQSVLTSVTDYSCYGCYSVYTCQNAQDYVIYVHNMFGVAMLPLHAY